MISSVSQVLLSHSHRPSGLHKEQRWRTKEAACVSQVMGRGNCTRTRRFDQFAHHNTCDHLHHNGSIAAVRWHRPHQLMCQNNWWEAHDVIGLPVLSAPGSDLLGDSFARQEPSPAACRRNGKASCVEMNSSPLAETQRKISVLITFASCFRFLGCKIERCLGSISGWRIALEILKWVHHKSNNL